MERRTFLNLSSGVAASMLLPFGRAIAAEELTSSMPVAAKKALADIALNAATKAGASYCRRAHRSLPQPVHHHARPERRKRGQHRVGRRGRARDRERRLRLCRHRPTCRPTASPTRRARRWPSPRPTPSCRPNRCAWHQSRAWATCRGATPIKKDWRTVPIKEKADLLIAANKAGMEGGANFMQSMLFQVNQQKYFASTDGSYIDQDVHRLWVPFFATAVDKASDKFRSRQGLIVPGGHGLRIPRRAARAQDQGRRRRRHAVHRIV